MSQGLDCQDAAQSVCNLLLPNGQGATPSL